MNEQRYLRFPLAYRIEHWVLTLSFTLLAITGLVQKYPLSGISQWTVGLLGGIVNTRTTSAWSATASSCSSAGRR